MKFDDMERYIDVDLSEEDVEEAKGKITREKIEEFIFKNRWVLVSGFVGLILVGLGVFSLRAGVFEGTRIEVLEATGGGSLGSGEVVVEISGAVEKPGVYKLLASERIERLLIEAGGLSAEADREWVGKNLNRAAKIIDGQKIYVPKTGEAGLRTKDLGGNGSVAGVSSGLVNLNTASTSELDGLSGIGSVRAQAIIDNRPYSSAEELLSKKVIPRSVYEKIKEKITAP